jgi:hypothetical protein
MIYKFLIINYIVRLDIRLIFIDVNINHPYDIKIFKNFI